MNDDYSFWKSVVTVLRNTNSNIVTYKELGKTEFGRRIAEDLGIGRSFTIKEYAQDENISTSKAGRMLSELVNKNKVTVIKQNGINCYNFI